MKRIDLRGVVGIEITAESLLEQIDINSKEKIQIHINSTGGSVFEAFDIFNILRSYQGEVEIVMGGYVASAASYITMAADKIKAYRNTIFMAHEPWTLSIGTYKDFLTMAKILQSMNNVLLDAYSKKLKIDSKDLERELSNELWIIGASELEKFSFVEGFIDDEKAKDDPSEYEEGQKNALKTDVREQIKNSEKKVFDAYTKKRFDYTGFAAKLDSSINLNFKTQDKLNMEETKMNFNEIMNSDSNVELKNEIQNHVDSKVKEIKSNLTKEFTEKFSNEQERISSILNLAGVKLSEVVVEAIAENKTPDEFSTMLIMSEAEKRNTSNESPFAKLKLDSTQELGQQAASNNVNAREDDSKFDELYEKKAKKAISNEEFV